MKRLISMVLCGVVLGSPAYAGCTLPTAPTGIPDGKTAAKDVMMAKKKEVDQYKKDVEAYATCGAGASAYAGCPMPTPRPTFRVPGLRGLSPSHLNRAAFPLSATQLGLILPPFTIRPGYVGGWRIARTDFPPAIGRKPRRLPVAPVGRLHRPAPRPCPGGG